MSFGWSAGDIVAAITLVNRIIKSVSSVGGARDHFQELESELGGLLQALTEIAELTSQPGQIPEIVALKFAACLCEDTLKRFYERIKPFNAALGVTSRTPKLKAAPRMVRWEILVKKDIPELRSFLVAHVGSLNLRLNTATLKITSRSFTNSSERYAEHQQPRDIIQGHLSTQARAEISSILRKDTVPTLDSLLTIANNVWRAQSDMMDMFAKALENAPLPDLRYTWAQAPVKFEDALGRIIPVPSEYGWDKLEAIIQAQFRAGPGYTKVRSGEYELFTKQGDIKPIRASTFCPLPGMSITMAFIVGQYADSQRCPRSGCNSQSFRVAGSNGKVCIECHSWFRRSRDSLPKPMKPPGMATQFLDRVRTANQPPGMAIQNMTAAQNDRRNYQNISIYITELPPTPTKFRDKYHRAKEPATNSAVRPKFAPGVNDKHSLFTSSLVSAQTEMDSRRQPRRNHLVDTRPQSDQLSAIPTVYVNSRPHTLDFESTSTDETQNSFRNASSYSAPGRARDQYKTKPEEMPAGILDQNFMDELSAIEQWFKVLSEAERTATLYAILQHATTTQTRFFIPVLQLGFNISSTLETRTSFRNSSNYSAPRGPEKDQYEMRMKEIAAVALDQDFKDEVSAIDQWFRVLNEAESTATLHALFQQATPLQIRFFIKVLQQIERSHLIYQKCTELSLLPTRNAESGNGASAVNTPIAPTFNTTSSTDMVATATAMKIAALAVVNNRFGLSVARTRRQ